MSSAISFPPNLTFKEFLSHTFPGFFLALSVLMLLAVLSPKDLTSWAFGTLTVFVSAMTYYLRSICHGRDYNLTFSVV